jgi:16S rRNA (cytosine967-C5)-methyltransferase
VFEHGAYADRAFNAEAAGLTPRDRALAMTLAYGTVQRRATLDHVAARLSSRSPAELDPPVLAALELGLLQLLLLGGIAEHAAVHESVELAKLHGRGGAGLVNAVLRRATREGRAILDTLSDDTPAGAATLHSVPPWLAELWWRELGAGEARALLAQINRPAESALRVNTLVSSVDAVQRELAQLAVPTSRVPGFPSALVLGAPFDLHGSELWGRGAVMAQSRGSMRAGSTLEPRPGDRVLDLCAAPGAKTTQLAALMDDQGALVAVERHPGRAQALARTLQRMKVTCATVQVTDAAAVSAAEPAYDRVLVDPPCSGLGTLQSRPDLRWRTSPERIANLSSLQARILRAGAAVTRPGGTLVYSVCTISRAEGEQVVEAFLSEQLEFRAEPLAGAGDQPWVQLMPHRDGTDGFFIARLRRT